MKIFPPTQHRLLHFFRSITVRRTYTISLIVASLVLCAANQPTNTRYDSKPILSLSSLLIFCLFVAAELWLDTIYYISSLPCTYIMLRHLGTGSEDMGRNFLQQPRTAARMVIQWARCCCIGLELANGAVVK